MVFESFSIMTCVVHNKLREFRRRIRIDLHVTSTPVYACLRHQTSIFPV